MHEIAKNLHLLAGRPKWAFNVYLLGDVLIDAGTRHAARRILRQLSGRRVHAHAVTHTHADHQGSSDAICRALGIPLWCPAGEVVYMESGDIDATAPSNVITRWQQRHWAGPGHAVERPLREGDEVAGFTVLDMPGHSPGMVGFWRESDRVLVAGDVIFNRHPLTGRPGVHEPPVAFTLDPDANRRAIRRVAELRPRVICAGHGPPRSAGPELDAFFAALPA